MSEALTLHVTGSTPRERVLAGQAVVRILSGSILRFATPPTGWDGDTWCVRCIVDSEQVGSLLAMVPALVDGCDVAVSHAPLIEPATEPATEPEIASGSVSESLSNFKPFAKHRKNKKT